MSKNLTIISEVNELANVEKYTFMTKEGKNLTVTGELAKDLSVYYGMSALGNKATFESAHRIRNIMNMSAETLNDKYGVKSGTAFITRYMGLAKGSVSNYKKVADYFFEADSSETRDSVFSVYNFAQLQELTVFIVKYMDSKQSDFDEAYMCLEEVAPSDFPYTMSANKIRKAVSEYFNTVPEPTETTETETTETETTETETTETETAETETADKRLTAETAYAILNRCESAKMCFDPDTGTYGGDEIEAHFLSVLDFVIGLLK